MAIEFTDREKASIKRDEAIGCGCAAFLPALVGPFITNFIGITPWPVPVLFLGIAILMLLMKQSASKLSWQAEVGFAALGFVTSTFIAVMIAMKPAAPPDAPVPTPVPTTAETVPSSTTVQKEVVRITIDEIQEKFAKNQVAGAQFFETRTALIPGVAVRVREALGTGILIVRSAQTGLEVEIGFNERGTRQLGAVEPGDKIEATCPEVYEAMSQIIIACESISIEQSN